MGEASEQAVVDEARRYRFDRYEVDVAAREIRAGHERVAVEPQVFDVLVVLLRERHRVVRKEELLDEVWGTRFVTESALTTRIKALRRALGDDGQRQAVVRTAHGVGFRFVADVEVEVAGRATPTAAPSAAGAAGASDLGAGEPPLQQDVRFCTASDGTQLAYSWMGAGPPLVKVANWLTHLDYDLESPVWRHWWRDLSRHHRLLRYDERGCGLSDLEVAEEDFSVDTWVRDLEDVVDAAGLDRFPLLGLSQGAAVAVAYAVKHPERVSRIVLWGGFLQGPAGRAFGPEQVREAHLLPELAQLGWGREEPVFRQVFTMKFLPDGTPGEWAAFNELQRRTTTPDNARRFMEAFNRIDVEDLAPQVQAPTLVLHARRDQLPPFEQGRRLAALIPNSTFVPLDSPNHLLQGHEPAWARFLEHVEAFLAEDG